MIPGLIIPAQHVPAQCAVIDPTPAGCLAGRKKNRRVVIGVTRR